MKLIDKDALVAWAKETYLCENASMIRKVCYKQLLERLDTLEVKEIYKQSSTKDLKTAAGNYAFTQSEEDEVIKYYAFIAGAQWQKEQVIEKACEGIEHLLSGYIIRNFHFLFGDSYEMDTLIEDFTKYMKGE